MTSTLTVNQICDSCTVNCNKPNRHINCDRYKLLSMLNLNAKQIAQLQREQIYPLAKYVKMSLTVGLTTLKPEEVGDALIFVDSIINQWRPL